MPKVVYGNGKRVLKITKDYIENYAEHGDKIPTMSGLASLIGCARETIHQWNRDENKPEFSELYDQLMACQERRLINGGLGNEYSSTITKLILAKHGYHEKQEVEHKGGVTLTFESKDADL